MQRPKYSVEMERCVRVLFKGKVVKKLSLRRNHGYRFEVRWNYNFECCQITRPREISFSSPEIQKLLLQKQTSFPLKTLTDKQTLQYLGNILDPVMLKQYDQKPSIHTLEFETQSVCFVFVSFEGIVCFFSLSLQTFSVFSFFFLFISTIFYLFYLFLHFLHFLLFRTYLYFGYLFCFVFYLLLFIIFTVGFSCLISFTQIIIPCTDQHSRTHCRTRCGTRP